jgi:hypothetical protein
MSEWETQFFKCLIESMIKNSTVEQAIALKQPHLPKHVYKYRQNDEYSWDNIKTNSVWVASPESYNDPYDCWLTFPEGILIGLLQKLSASWRHPTR